jgi:hypothetical protein
VFIEWLCRATALPTDAYGRSAGNTRLTTPQIFGEARSMYFVMWSGGGGGGAVVAVADARWGQAASVSAIRAAKANLAVLFTGVSPCGMGAAVETAPGWMRVLDSARVARLSLRVQVSHFQGGCNEMPGRDTRIPGSRGRCSRLNWRRGWRRTMTTIRH